MQPEGAPRGLPQPQDRQYFAYPQSRRGSGASGPGPAARDGRVSCKAEFC